MEISCRARYGRRIIIIGSISLIRPLNIQPRILLQIIPFIREERCSKLIILSFFFQFVQQRKSEIRIRARNVTRELIEWEERRINMSRERASPQDKYEDKMDGGVVSVCMFSLPSVA